MTLDTGIRIVVVGGLGIAALIALVVARPWVWREFGRRDPVIDGLIEAKRARPCPQMSAVDWQLVDRAGRRRWAETLKAQQATARPREPRPALVKVAGWSRGRS